VISSDGFKFLGLYLAFNLLAFALYFLDKTAARNGHRRISERTLLMLAFLGGSIGAVAAQKLLRHKTQKEPFRSILKAIVVLHVTLAVAAGSLFVAEKTGFI
jgi:uncharacterized membrane protein YsdA (DUF1294 family)